MELTKLNSILSTANVAGISQFIIDATETGHFIRGVDSESSIVLFSEYSEKFSDKTIGIFNASSLYNRLSLFDLTKTKVDVEEKDSFVRAIKLREKNKKLTYTFSDPNLIKAPKSIANSEIRCKISLTKEQISGLAKAISAVDSKKFTLIGSGKDIIVKLSDINSDIYQDVVGEQAVSEWSVSWKTDSVMRLLKQAAKDVDTVELVIGELGMMYVNVERLDFIVIPQV